MQQAISNQMTSSFRGALFASMDGVEPEYMARAPRILAPRHVSAPSILGNKRVAHTQNLSGWLSSAEVLARMAGGFPASPANLKSTLRWAFTITRRNQLKTRNYLVAVLSAVALSACVAPAPRLNLNDSQAVAGAISVQHDDFKKVTNYKGPNAAVGMFDSLFIRAWKTDATGSVNYQIYVMDYYDGDWRFYNSAHDSNGNSLDTTQISRDVGSCSSYGGCSHFEHLGLNVTREYLEKNQENGIRFKVSGKAGEEVFFIPSAYIKAFLSEGAAINKVKTEITSRSKVVGGGIGYDAPSLKAKQLIKFQDSSSLETVVKLDNWSKVRDGSGALYWVENRALDSSR